MREAHVAELDFGAEVHDVEDLVGELARIYVAAMCVVCNKGNIKRANMRDVRKTLKKVMLQKLVKRIRLARSCNIPNPCNR